MIAANFKTWSHDVFTTPRIITKEQNLPKCKL